MKIMIFLCLLFIMSYAKKCERDLMGNYGLRGYFTSKEELNPFCQTIKRNCCRKSDLIKIYEQHASQMVPTLENFHKQMRENFQKLQKLNDQMSSIKFKDTENRNKKIFCKKATLEFQKFKFQPMMRSLNEGLEKSILEFRSFHQSFYCTLCDAEAHVHYDLQSRKVNLDSRNCTNHIRRNKDFIEALNIKLIDYLEKMQNLLDCSFYETHFEFPFLFDYQETFRKHTQICLNNFDEESNEISENCNELCGSLNIAGISSHFQGSPKFLAKAIDYYENLIEEVEREKKENAKNKNGDSQVSKFNPLQHLDELNHHDPPVNVKLVSENPVNRQLKQLKKNSKFVDIFNRNLLKSVKKNRPRILEEKRKLFIKNVIKDDKRVSRMLEESKNEKKSDNGELSPEKIKHYKDIYESMSAKFHPDSQEIFKRTIDPYNLQKFQKFYLYEQGLNLFDYLKGLNFDLNKDEIMRTVHGHKGSEKLDYNSQIILDCISEDSIKEIFDSLSKEYVFQIPENLQNPEEKNLAALPNSDLDPEEQMSKIEKKVEEEVKEEEKKEKETTEPEVNKESESEVKS